MSVNIITIVSSTWTLALNVKRLVQSVRDRDEIAKELEDKMDTLTTILGQANNVYGSEESQTYSPSEEQIRQAVRKVLIRCHNDLKRLEATLNKFLSHGNWVSVAWKQQVAAPTLVRFNKSISERQQHLSMLLQLLQGLVDDCSLVHNQG